MKAIKPGESKHQQVSELVPPRFLPDTVLKGVHQWISKSVYLGPNGKILISEMLASTPSGNGDHSCISSARPPLQGYINLQGWDEARRNKSLEIQINHPIQECYQVASFTRIKMCFAASWMGVLPLYAVLLFLRGQVPEWPSFTTFPSEIGRLFKKEQPISRRFFEEIYQARDYFVMRMARFLVWLMKHICLPLELAIIAGLIIIPLYYLGVLSAAKSLANTLRAQIDISLNDPYARTQEQHNIHSQAFADNQGERLGLSQTVDIPEEVRTRDAEVDTSETEQDKRTDEHLAHREEFSGLFENHWGIG